MAEFSNRNFVTAGTNFTGSDEEVTPYEGLPRPAPFANFDTTVAEITGNPDSCHQACSSDQCEDLVEVCLPGKMSFYSALATDNLTESPAAREVIIARASMLSIFDQWLRHKRVCVIPDSGVPDDGRCINRAFTLNSFNFPEMYAALLPRAVDYSAGLINYFFRGRLAVTDASVTGDKVTITLQNDSATDEATTFNLASEPNALAPGFRILYEATDGKRKPLLPDLSWHLSEPLAYGGSHRLEADLPDDVDLEAEAPFVVIFWGLIGEEPGMATVPVELSSGGGFIVTPSVTPADGIGGPRLIEKVGGQWTLSQETGLVAGNIDWKGFDGELLTFTGPSGRSLPQRKVDSYEFGYYFSYLVYRGGSVLAEFPFGDVLGASIRQTVDGERWLNVVSYDEASREDRLYSRPLDGVDEAYDAQNQPRGWRLLAAAARSDNYKPHTPWFFNASGTEAQTIRHLNNFRRHKVVVGADGVSAQFSVVGEATPIIKERVITAQNHEYRPWTAPSLEGCEGGKTWHIFTSADLVETTSGGGELIIAVDYQGEDEIVGRMVVDERGLIAESLKGSVADIEPVCVNRQVVPKIDGDKKYVRSSDWESRIEIVVGDVAVPVEAGFDRVEDHSDDRAFRYDREFGWGPYSTVHYMDVRYPVIAYYSEGGLSTDSKRGTYGETEDVSEYLQDRRSDLVMFRGDAPLVAYEYVDDWASSSTGPVSYTRPAALDELLRYSELPGAIVLDGDQKRRELDVVGRLKFMAPQARTYGSWQVDSQGNLAVSQKAGYYYYGADPDRRFNYLSGGDLPGLFGTAPENAAFYPIKIK